MFKEPITVQMTGKDAHVVKSLQCIQRDLVCIICFNFHSFSLNEKHFSVTFFFSNGPFVFLLLVSLLVVFFFFPVEMTLFHFGDDDVAADGTPLLVFKNKT